MILIPLVILGFLLGSSNAALQLKQDNHQHDEKFYQIRKQALKDTHYYVHLIPHTHDDVGWLKTPDEYFSGSKYTIQKAGVELILNTVIDELLLNTDRKFTYVEMKFFSMWWKYQTDDMKAKVKQMVKDGRLEFLNAGWSMHDEACPYFEDMINNMLHGQQFLLQEFGVKPRVAWHIDPFGHSSANPRLFAEMGFDAWFFARIDYQDRERRLDAQEMEFIWRPMFNHFGSKQQIFSHCMFDNYHSPTGFDWDTRGGDDPIEDDIRLSSYNADEKVKSMMDWVTNLAPHYKSNHLFVVMGEDFNYAQAKLNFQSIDKLIKNFNANYTNVTLMYSTPSQYLDALRQMDAEWPTKYDDMFPYADKNTSFWTGYFTSRANAKYYVRKASSNLHASLKAYSLQAIDQTTSASRISDILAAKSKMMDALGILQHHDAVTGTARQAVAENYNSRLAKGIDFNNRLFSQVVGESVKKLIPYLAASPQQWSWCVTENATYLDCPVAGKTLESLQILVAVFNPSPQPQNYVSIAVPSSKFTVKAFNQTSNMFYSPNAVVICEEEYFDNGYSVDNCWLHVELTIQGQQYGVLTVVYNATNDLRVNLTDVGTPAIQSDFEKLTFNDTITDQGQTFLIEKIQYPQNFSVDFDLRYWPSYQSEEDNAQNSGAYIFRVADNISESLRYSAFKNVSYVQTAVVSQMTINYLNDKNESAQVRIRLFKKNPVIEWTVRLNGIPLTEQGQEVVVQFVSHEINNNKTFYTDSNGLEMQQRILDNRPTWNFTSNLTITQNYYPINSALAVRDVSNGNQMTIMTTKTHGGSSLKKGQIEIMQNRRMYYDDRRGVAEPLNETDELDNGMSVSTTYYMQVFNRSAESSQQRLQQMFVDDPLQVFFNFNTNLTVLPDEDPVCEHYSSQRSLSTSELTDLGLPQTGKIQIFPMAQNSLLIRLTNIADKFDLGNSPVVPYIKIDDLALQIYQLVNGPTTKPLQTIISETSHTANQLYNQMKAGKTGWKGVDDDEIIEPTQPNDRSIYEIALEPQRIRTFQIQYVPPQTVSMEFLH